MERRDFIKKIGIASMLGAFFPGLVKKIVAKEKKTFTEEALEKFGTGEKVSFKGSFEERHNEWEEYDREVINNVATALVDGNSLDYDIPNKIVLKTFTLNKKGA